MSQNQHADETSSAGGSSASAAGSDGFLGNVARWNPEDEFGATRTSASSGATNSVRTSRMIGTKLGFSPPPPPPGPPPTAPPPLPPSSAHPFSSNSLPRRSSRHSRLQSITNSNYLSGPSSPPPRPPPTADLPPLPSSVTGHRRTISNVSRQSVSVRSPPSGSPAGKTVPIPSATRPSTGGSGSGSPRGTTPSVQPLPESAEARAKRTPSRHLLQSALDLAQRAVEMDRTNNVEGALAAYTEAVSRLKSVMNRVGVESSHDKRTSTGRTEQEGRTLKGIHDAYLARIQLLLDMRDAQTQTQPNGERFPEEEEADSEATPPGPTPRASESGGPTQTPNSASSHGHGISPASDLTSAERTPRQSEDAGTGIGAFMLEDHSDTSSPPFRPRKLSMDAPAQQPLQSPVAAPIQPPPRRTSITHQTGPVNFKPQVAPGFPSTGAPVPRLGGAPSTVQRRLIDSHVSEESDDGTEMLTKTPVHGAQQYGTDDVEPLSQQPTSFMRQEFGEQNDKSLPPLPHSAPISDLDGAFRVPEQGRVDPNTVFSSSAGVHGHEQQRFSGGEAVRARTRSQPGSMGRTSFDAGPPSLPPLHHQPSFGSRVPSLGGAATSLGASSGLRINTDHSASSTLFPPPVFSAVSSQSSNRSQTTLAPSTNGSLISPLPEPQPAEIVHRPFHLLRMLCLSMDPDSTGSYLSGAIHISSAVWKPANWAKAASANGKALAPPKIASQDVKARILEALVGHFDAVRSAGGVLLDGPRDASRGQGVLKEGGVSSATALRVAEDLCGALDGLLEEMDNSYRALGKAGIPVGEWKGGKARSKGNSLSWSSKFSKTMDKMTSSKAGVESPDRYVDLLSNFCFTAQIINDHLLNFTGPCTPPYAGLSDKTYKAIEGRLSSASQFIGVAIVPFILIDCKQFCLRYLKGGIRYLED